MTDQTHRGSERCTTTRTENHRPGRNPGPRRLFLRGNWIRGARASGWFQRCEEGGLSGEVNELTHSKVVCRPCDGSAFTGIVIDVCCCHCKAVVPSSVIT
ncbi:hypothetical protein COCON_G00168930 [Conger conger]|uniref:Uncharacterized protein n=1 Tax=Conger conger TaxID=82655 RepID=A0A9Q1HTZ0_CONCO|nr:hypothetical protein COCON_G00168930 [Conger conger]